MSTSTIRIMCPNLTCRKILAVPPGARGKTVRCKACGTCIKIPHKPTTETNASAPQQG